jgi:hypothetical protein
VRELLGNLPFDKPPSEKDRKILVDALIKAFPGAAKGMATVSRVCKQQVKRLNVRTTRRAQCQPNHSKFKKEQPSEQPRQRLSLR